MKLFNFPDVITSKSLSYDEYRKLIDDLFAENKVTGHVQSQGLIDYTKMNLHRMNRHDKHTKLPDSFLQTLDKLDRNIIILAISEGWCGDASQVLPIINHMAESSNLIDFRIILRDDNPEIMDQYLYNGTRSIPIIIGIDAETGEELFVWGPRPNPAKQLMEELKENPAISSSKRGEEIQRWYAKDRSETLFFEFDEILSNLNVSV